MVKRKSDLRISHAKKILVVQGLWSPLRVGFKGRNLECYHYQAMPWVPATLNGMVRKNAMDFCIGRG